MTGSRALRCVCCQIVRSLYTYRTRQTQHTLRHLGSTAVLYRGKYLSTSASLFGNKNDDGDSSSSDSSSSESSSGSESDSDSERLSAKSENQVKSEGQTKSEPKSSATAKKTDLKQQKETPVESASIDPTLMSAAKSVAESLPGDSDETEASLVSKLLAQYKTAREQKAGMLPGNRRDAENKPTDFTEVMRGFQQVKKQQQSRQRRGADKFSKDTEGKSRQFDLQDDDETIDQLSSKHSRPKALGLFSGTPLGIFSKEDLEKQPTGKKDLFDIVEAERKEEMYRYPPQHGFEEMIQWTREGKLWTFPIDNEAGKKDLFDVVEAERKEEMYRYPPQHGFEEMIQWTREGKLWTFPIDNEAGWEEEKKVSFHEHVFLENEIKDFPTKGPIRHFMELITITLSKNPYLTVEQKREHIDWYRNYFKDKQDVLESRLGDQGIIRDLTSGDKIPDNSA